MLGFILIFGLGLIVAMTYNAIADKGEASEKLKRVQAQIAKKEALEKGQALDKEEEI